MYLVSKLYHKEARCMKKIFCEKCQDKMEAICNYESPTLMPKTVEVHQCINPDCLNRFRHYWINGNRAIYLGMTSSPEPKF
jgi:hypothetical protein